jgi:hypothetical protein
MGVRDFAGDTFDIVGVGAQPLKGFANPVEVFAVEWR